MSFASLPVEILQQILALLPASDLNTVCLANTHPFAVSQPLLYASITLTWRKDGILLIASLLLTLLRRPHLADHVAALQVNGLPFRFRWWTSRTPNVPVSAAHLAGFVTCVNAMHLPYRHLWVTELQEGRTDALIALLLSQLANLRSLHLESGPVKENHPIGKLLTSTLRSTQNQNLPRFPRLRTVTFLPPRPGLPDAPDFWYQPGNISNLPSLFYLPALEHLHA